ncbi:SDR family NAD(P)-dependent oxidoreductase [Hydrogenophaga sp.]|uniref:SDR family NAD(P)-dependent oxidoreductase n=1 Tax=Hydrogenophaga sp. TaxID=1904254 RepID=UPI00261B6197|nr:SDR family NAD(P)-dependent oxidoreductase [Hydrogenophaga sp.]MCW5653800.1 SDR family oxidoreductase [Hydrogenophaga sp.]
MSSAAPATAPRVALVTGAASGIGLAIATQFVRDGITTVMLDRSAEVQRVADELEGRTHAIVCDVADEAQIRAAVAEVDQRHGRCDILVNNAGIHPKRDGGKFTIEQIPSAQWRDVLAINLTAPFLFCQLVMPLMRRHRWGRVINISSRGGRTVSPVASAHYAATKAGLIGFTRIAALEGAPDGITANSVTPGPILSAMTAGSSPEVRAAFTRSVPLGRYGDPEEIASAVSYLASDASSFITGAIFDINGGTYMP